MNRIIIALTVAAALLWAAPASALQPHTPVFVDPAQDTTVKAGEEFFIALPANVSTGFSWTPAGYDPKILAYDGNVYRPPVDSMPGEGGEQIFIFHANRSGLASISFIYTRPFDPNNIASAKTLTFNVTVQ